jgi:hypothetical protein
MTSNRRLRAAEFVLWVASIAAAVVGVGAVLSFALGDGLLTLKYLLFVVGFLMFGVGSVGIQPRVRRPSLGGNADGESAPRGSLLGSLSTDSDDEYGFEERIQRLPPLRDERLPVVDRVSRDWKLFAASLVVLGVSLLLEAGLGVAA